MTSLALPREAVVVDKDQQELDKLYSFDALAQAAEEKLGYRLLQERLNSGLREHAKQRLSLKQAMLKLDIQPFKKRAVERYMKAMEWRVLPRKTKLVTITLAVTLILFLTGAGCLLAAGITALISYLWVGAVPVWVGLVAGASLVVGVLGIFWQVVLTEVKTVEAKWESVLLRHYREPVPEFVLQTALDLKEKFPAAKFSVQELRLQARTRDPFLVVEDPAGNAYYIEVWNEPGFMQKREC